MTIVLQLPPDTEALLRDRAEREGVAPETLALETLRAGLGDEEPSVPILSSEAWLAEFDAWIAGLKPGNPNFDDSRESIYPDRS
jgi:hypothetical protein